MSSILRIKEQMSSYTKGEKRIASYIIDNLDLVIQESSQVVAKKTGTSPSTVVRFSKRLGYQGFTDLKLRLAQDKQSPDMDMFESIIESDDDIHALIMKAQHANENTFNKAYKLLDENLLEKSISALTEAESIYVVGLGGSSIVAQDLYHKLTRIDKRAVYTQDFHMLLTSLTFIKETDVCIAFSYSGETYEAVLAQKQAKENGAMTVSITANPRSSISKYSDMVLLIPKEEKELRLGAISSRFSFLVVSDLLYFGVAKRNLKVVSSKLEASRALLKDLSR